MPRKRCGKHSKTSPSNTSCQSTHGLHPCIGPCTFRLGLATYLCSKKFYIMEHEFYTGPVHCHHGCVRCEASGTAKFLDAEVAVSGRTWPNPRRMPHHSFHRLKRMSPEQDHQKFMSFLECVDELFIRQHENNPRNMRDFLQLILSSDFRSRVSCRFLTVIIRTILSIRSGVRITDELLFSTLCNRLTRQLNANAHSLLFAFLACADQDVQNDPEEEKTGQDVLQATMTGNWTVNLFDN
ncbi:hypothetical protein DAPPUDRAFT_109662 [Daphnia pulex]|uniref:Uncharacterized protein n=1 Tax=Daphnia pulex TaxID=6669 RepID=E9H3S2_DAPPU|nr:hypothetical protein DAPPUDRAFT_109662 [Daphnia pulex]|eukprot:EFX73569.1 hypothetical protein DAPPUDRAFT_109662 [Daphnia pulex]